MAIELDPIGTVHTPYSDWAPHHPPERQAPRGRFTIVLEEAYAQHWMEGLESFEYVYVITYLNAPQQPPSPRVRPPWAKGREVGLYASRSPNRPCPLGLTIVRLLEVEGAILHTAPLDLLDGTPVLDIKPYIASLDAKGDANDGWIEEMEGHEHVLQHLRGVEHEHGEGHEHGHHHEDNHAHEHGHSHDHDHGSGRGGQGAG